MARLDHITVVAPDLAAGSAYVAAALGVAPGPGRAHPHMGTHNRLLALGPGVYLEVIAVDPAAAPIARARWFGLDRILPTSPAKLAAWVASTHGIENIVDPELGQVETMRRDVHTWQMTVRPDGAVPLEGAAPLLIQRTPGADPVAALPQQGLRFERLVIQHPAPHRVLALLAKTQLAPHPPVTVVAGGVCRLVAEIRTPSGLRRLGEA